ncbi:MAG TPA: DUF1289 domain-containing protein [Methylophaga aminisulfidivorans]|uniref:DUF1289 domain-containing protein n=2 Tax=root TaxID=1 RepID=A0A7C2AQV1_9GAMM|nr:DUF1289 domain-containing protein [Methylophaga aminisulfidivorans]HEC74894.1 DUF1289 domain-containing protein [Methylophaga aminisulfidivorans]
MTDSTSPKKPIPSPCLRKCCLDARDVCMGCYRQIDEITGWAAMSEIEKLATLERCNERRRLRLANKKKLHNPF